MYASVYINFAVSFEPMYIRIKVYFSFNPFSSFTTVIKESTLALLHQYVTSNKGKRLQKLAGGKCFMIHMTHVCLPVKGNVYVFIQIFLLLCSYIVTKGISNLFLVYS